jgi:hypothetical protein
MAKKHKSKYKAPKDEAKSQKPETRKDMKDYTAEDAPNMVPGGVKGVQPNVPRKYATDVIDNIENMVPEIKDRLYKKIEDGEYSAADARKLFDKLQIKDAEEFLKKLERIDHGAITNSMVKPENEEKLQEQIDSLSAENKERLLREYVRRKIAIMIREQGSGPSAKPTKDSESSETPEPAPAAPEPAPATPEPAPAASAPAPTAPAAPTPAAPTPEKPPMTPAAAFQQDIIQKVKSVTNPENTITSIYMTSLEDALNKFQGITGNDINKNQIFRNIILWMRNNRFNKKNKK